MANAEHIALVIRAIRGEHETNVAREAIGFNMAGYVCGAKAELEDKSRRGCGTVACIAGHAYLLATSNGADFAIADDPDVIERIAAGYIGVGSDEAAHLFYDLPIGHELEDVTAEEAIDTLERLALTGTIEWRLN